MTCNSQNDNLIWKWIHFPKTCSRYSIFVADLEQTPFFLKSDLNINPLLPNVPFDPPENIRKPLVFWSFQGDQKGTLGSKGLTTCGSFALLKNSDI